MSDGSITDVILDDLRRRLRRASEAEHQAIELRKFLEAVHIAMSRLLEFDPTKVYIDRWFNEMNRAPSSGGPGLTIHPDKYSPLSIIYRQGNIPAHENEESLLIRPAACREHLRTVETLVPPLVADMRKIGFELEDEILRARSSATHLHRAQRLVDAANAAVSSDRDRLEQEVWPIVDEAVLELDERKAVGLRKNPHPDKRIQRAVVVILAAGAGATEACPLSRLGAALGLDDWCLEDRATQVMLRQHPRRLNLLRVELEPAGDEEWGPIRRAALYLEDGRRIEIPGRFPIDATSEAGLYRAIKQLVSLAGEAVGTERSTALEPRELVLQIAMPAGVAMRDWESIKPLGPKGTLADAFLAVAIDPLDDDDMRVEMREPLDSTRIALAWEPDPETLRSKYRDHYVLLAGPPAWQSELDGRPPILWAMSQRAGAALLPQAELADAEQAVDLPDLRASSVTWADLVERLGELKRSNAGGRRGAYRIFWVDQRYSTLPAYNV